MPARCRVCGRALFEEPLLQYANMPRVAQFFPDRSTVGADTGLDLGVFQCAGCGLVQLRTEPVPYYKQVVRAAGLSEEMRAFRAKQFGRFVEKFSLAGRKVIEIGCGRGEYLSIMRDAGTDAFGVEYAPASVAACAQAGLKVSEAFVETPETVLPNAPFDAFMILNFLEHLPDPGATLRGIHANLAPGGVGLVEVPNFDMILREQLFAEFTSDHLFYFTADTLTTTLSLNGFDVVECTEEWHDYVLSATVRKRERLDLSAFHAHHARLRDDVHAWVRRFTPGKVAVWGAGHQALALLSLLGLEQSIRYVVDSAPFKQGKFTPATHLPIVAPSTLESDPVEAVLIMAAAYSDEVARQVRERFRSDLHVAIWRESGLQPV